MDKNEQRTEIATDTVKDRVKDEVKHGQKFEDLISKSEPLIRIRSVFPFDFFPDEISVDVAKVNIIHREFLTKRVQSVYIKNISDVVVNTSILFASLGIIDFGFQGNSVSVNYLSKKDALRTRKIIQGLVVCHKEEIDLTQFDAVHFKQKIEMLGEAEAPV